MTYNQTFNKYVSCEQACQLLDTREQIHKDLPDFNAGHAINQALSVKQI